MNALPLLVLGLMPTPQSAPQAPPPPRPDASPAAEAPGPTREPGLSHDLFGVAIDAAGDRDGDGVRSASDRQGVVVLLSGKSLRTLRHFVRAGRE